MKYETPPQYAAAARRVGDSPLTTILDMLSGEGGDDPDSVLARLPAEHLDCIAAAAQRKGQDCLDLVRCLVDCIANLLMRLKPADACDRILRPVLPSHPKELPEASFMSPEASPEREKTWRERLKVSLFSLPAALKRRKASLLTHHAALKSKKA
ncbi:hypothetical protein [Pseudoxanthomonas mexicana]